MSRIKVSITNHRESPIVVGYRPHLRVHGSKIYLGVEFLDGDEMPILSGMTACGYVKPIHEPEVNYDLLSDDSTFDVLEGPNIIGVGHVVHRREN